MSAGDCKPHKALRTTIKVFLRTEEKKREALRLKELKEATPNPQVEVPTLVEVSIPEITEPSADAFIKQSPSTEQQGASEIIQDADEISEAQKDVPHQSIEVCKSMQQNFTILTDL